MTETTADLVAWVRSADRREQLALALPEDVSIDRFERLTATALLQQPELVSADRTTLWFALLDAAKRGLAPDGRQGTINVYKTKVKRNGQEQTIDAATFIPMIAGVRDELAKYGWALRTNCVYSADEFHYDEADDIVTHVRASLTSERGEVIGAWAQLIRLRDGFRLNEVMNRQQLEDVRDKARAAGNPLWRDRFPQACEKTVGHRLAKKAPLDPKERERLDIVIAGDLENGESAALLYGHTEIRDGTPIPDDAPSPAGDQLDPVPPAGLGALDDEPGLPPTGEITDADLQALAVAAEAYVPPNGKFSAGGEHGPKTLGQIMELGDPGVTWFRWALPRITEPAEYAAALTSYTRVFAPGLYQELLAKKALG